MRRRASPAASTSLMLSRHAAAAFAPEPTSYTTLGAGWAIHPTGTLAIRTPDLYQRFTPRREHKHLGNCFLPLPSK